MIALTFGALDGCDARKAPEEASSAPGSVTAPSPPEPASPWDLSDSVNAVTSEKTTVASTSSGQRSFIIRRRGRMLECYVDTDEFLETMDNLHSRRAAVKYRIDEGAPVSATWTLSDSNTGLFCPDPEAFLTRLSKSKTFAFEFTPSGKVPSSVVFDVSQYPRNLLPTTTRQQQRPPEDPSLPPLPTPEEDPALLSGQSPR